MRAWAKTSFPISPPLLKPSQSCSVVSFSLEMSLEFSTSLKTCPKILLELCSLLCCYNNLSSSVLSCNIIAGTFLNVWVRDIALLLANLYWFWFVSRIQFTILGEKIQNSNNQAPSYFMFITSHSLNRSHAPMYQQQPVACCILSKPCSHMLLYLSITLPVLPSFSNNHVPSTILGAGQNFTLHSIKIFYLIIVHIASVLKSYPASSDRCRGILIMCLSSIFIRLYLSTRHQGLCLSLTSLTHNKVLGFQNNFNFKSIMNEWMNNQSDRNRHSNIWTTKEIQ